MAIYSCTRLLPVNIRRDKFMVQLLHPRRLRQFTTLVALLSVILLSAFLLLVCRGDASDSLALRSNKFKLSQSQLALILESVRKSKQGFPEATIALEQIRLTVAQELAAVSSFLASLLQNQIPSFVDPSVPIDPQLVLDFDTRGSRASKEVQAMVEDVWSRNPVFLYSKHYSSASRGVKALLDEYDIKPSPTIIEVDMRDDADVLIPMLQRLTSVVDFPILIIAGKPIGTTESIYKMNDDGTLRQRIIESGAVIDGVKKKH